MRPLKKTVAVVATTIIMTSGGTALAAPASATTSSDPEPSYVGPLMPDDYYCLDPSGLPDYTGFWC